MIKEGNKTLLIYIFFWAFLVRLITAVFYLNYDEHALTMHKPFLSDEIRSTDVMQIVGNRDLYNSIATNIILYGEIGETDGRPPLYPIFLALSYTFFGYNAFGFFIAQILLASGTALLIFILGERLFNREIAVLSSVLYIFNPHFILLSIQLYSETLYFFIVLFIFHLCRKAISEPPPKFIDVYLGIAIAVAALCRHVFLVFIPFIFIWMFFVMMGNKKRMLKYIFVIFIVSALLYTPWLVYSYESVVTPTLMSISKSGWEADDYNETERIEFSPEVYREEVDSFVIWLFKNPKYFVKRIIEQFRIYFLTPYAKGVSLRHKITSTLIFLVLYPLGYLGLIVSIIQRQKIGYLVLLFVLSMVLFHSLHFLTVADGELRYRLPLELFITIYAANGMVSIYNIFRKEKETEEDSGD
ncbi:MAG: glycosyltransferase family 39 protein [Candidatus Omnitrophica bacterium]|nr:glycosyltransferase family 39 protein [Candidatus Omnitrophota bacterium]